MKGNILTEVSYSVYLAVNISGPVTGVQAGVPVETGGAVHEDRGPRGVTHVVTATVWHREVR